MLFYLRCGICCFLFKLSKFTRSIHPRNLTWNPKMKIMKVWNMFFLFTRVILRFHVSFPGCIFLVSPQKTACGCCYAGYPYLIGSMGRFHIYLNFVEFLVVLNYSQVNMGPIVPYTCTPRKINTEPDDLEDDSSRGQKAIYQCYVSGIHFGFCPRPVTVVKDWILLVYRGFLLSSFTGWG